LRGEQQMQDAIRNYEDVDSWKTVIFLYNAALKEVGTKLEILTMNFSTYINTIQSSILKRESKHRRAL